jgi:uncharacterized membrane protein
MTKGIKSLRVLGTNFMICIGAGHGFGPMILLEFFAIEDLLFNHTSESFYTTLPNFSFMNSYEDMLVYFILFSSLGQIVLLISYFKFFKIKVKRIIRFSGILLMVFGFFLISKNLFSDALAVFSFVTGIPFLYFVVLEIKFSLND